MEIQAVLDACMHVTSPWAALFFMLWLLVSYVLVLNVFFAFLIDTVDSLIKRPRRREFFRVTRAGVRRVSQERIGSSLRSLNTR